MKQWAIRKPNGELMLDTVNSDKLTCWDIAFCDQELLDLVKESDDFYVAAEETDYSCVCVEVTEVSDESHI